MQRLIIKYEDTDLQNIYFVIFYQIDSSAFSGSGCQPSQCLDFEATANNVLNYHCVRISDQTDRPGGKLRKLILYKQLKTN